MSHQPVNVTKITFTASYNLLVYKIQKEFRPVTFGLSLNDIALFYSTISYKII